MRAGPWIVLAAFLCSGVGGGLALRAAVLVVAQQPPPGASIDDTPIDPNIAKIAALEQQLAKAEADIVHFKAEFATCQATEEQTRHQLQSTELSADVAKLIHRYKALFGGDWTWDNALRQLVPVPTKKPTDVKEKP